jgi:monofunctional biosynthetic peptidoglycan transglycosylase
LRSWRIALELAAVAAAVIGLAVWSSIPDVGDLAAHNPATTAFIELRRAEAAAKGERFELRWTWKPLARISPHLRRAVVMTEDWKFWSHEGVDWDAIEAAWERGIARGEFARGGSTITQQLAKNLYLSPERSMVRKLRELLITYRLEDELAKERILEIYLNVAEWGPGIFGAEAAARRYYRVSAAELSPEQAVRLALALPNPLERSPEDRSAALEKRAARVLRMMGRAKPSPSPDPTPTPSPSPSPSPSPTPSPSPSPQPSPSPTPSPSPSPTPSPSPSPSHEGPSAEDPLPPEEPGPVTTPEP